MTISIRSLLNPELKIAEMSSEWWMKQVLMLLIMNRGILLAALRDVPSARDCYQIGLGHGQCVEVSDTQNPITAVMNAMRKRMTVMNGCDIYVKSWPDQKLVGLCAIVGIKNIYYANGAPSDDELKSLKTCGVEVIHVSV